MSQPPTNPHSNEPFARGEPCPKCRMPLEGDGWCSNCSKRRKVVTTLMLLVGMPVIGFGSCLIGLSTEPLVVLAPVGILLLLLGPIAGLIYLFLALFVLRK